MRRANMLLVALAAPLFTACETPCQVTCTHMMDFREECGLPVSNAELGECLDFFGRATAQENQTCIEMGTPDMIRRQWSCEDLTQVRGLDEER